MPVISVIIPTYNRCKLLKRAIYSVLQQSYQHYEIIIVDDGSTDATATMIQQVFPEVHYYYQENSGVSQARNTGISYANGEWLAFLDSDDEWLANKLTHQMDALQQQPDYQVCHTEERWIRHGMRVNPMKKHQKSGGWIFQQCLPLCVMSPSSILIHRNVFNQIGYFDTALPACEDYDLWLRITARYPVLYLPEAQIIKYGGHDDQLSKKYWGMDRYRIQALQKIITTTPLSKENRQAAIMMLLKKSRIVQQGARKRNKQQDVQYYQQIIDKFGEKADK